MRAPSGFIIIEKPRGITSHDCVSRVRRILNIKRVGHGGTLDPEVTGVLPIAIGEATRLLRFLPGNKTYQALLQLGHQTKTDDIFGETLKIEEWPELKELEINDLLNKFRGNIQQVPPQVSSIHIKGERAYKRVRRGEELRIAARAVNIYEIKLTNWNQAQGQIGIQVSCSAGTYIRSIARDLGNLIGCGGCLARLRRTEAMGFNESQTIPLPETNSNDIFDYSKIINPLLVLTHLPKLQLVSETEANFWRTGRPIITTTNRYQPGLSSGKYDYNFPDNSVAVIDLIGELAGIAQWLPPSTLKPKIVFHSK